MGLPKIKEIIKRAPEGRTSLDVCHLVIGHGIEGDRAPKDGRRQVAFSGENPGRDGGLCGSRYGANLVVEGMDFGSLHENMLLAIGETVLRITQLGKECFPNCPLVVEGQNPCYLQEHCGFLAVEQGGAIRLGDGVFEKVL